MKISRIVRLIQIIGMLQSGSGLHASAIAQECGVSRRTIFRDLETLRAAGVPLTYNDELSEYRIPGSYFLPPTNFTAEEALAVMLLCYQLGKSLSVPLPAARHLSLKAACRRVFATISRTSPAPSNCDFLRPRRSIPMPRSISN